MTSGIYIIDKEKGITSRDVCNQLVKKFHTKKVGHAGTLDPLATGVLVVAVGEGTKILEFLVNDEKEYLAEVMVGVESDTLDCTGNLKYHERVSFSKKQIEDALKSFLGSYLQEVPKYSAVHVDGKRLYEYARLQQEVSLPKRKVDIFSIELLDVSMEDGYQTFSFRVRVSKGCYIRSLIRDLGEKLGSPCIMKNLRREKEGIFDLTLAKKMDDLEEKDGLSFALALKNYPKKIITDSFVLQKIQNGCKLKCEITELTCFYNERQELLAIYVPDGEWMKPKKVFVQRNFSN